MSDSVQPHRRQSTRLPHPWDSPGKNTGVGCHCLLQCMKLKSEREVAQSCLTPSDPMDCSLPVSSIPGIFQARVLEWGAIAFSKNILILHLLLAQLSVRGRWRQRGALRVSYNPTDNRNIHEQPRTWEHIVCMWLCHQSPQSPISQTEHWRFIHFPRERLIPKVRSAQSPRMWVKKRLTVAGE